MAAGTYDFTNTMVEGELVKRAIEQGATFSTVLRVKDAGGEFLDFTGCTARMSIRRRLGDTTTLIDLTTANSRIILSAAADVTDETGNIQLLIDAEDTADLNFNEGVYDLEVEYPSGFVDRVLEGTIELTKEVTR